MMVRKKDERIRNKGKADKKNERKTVFPLGFFIS